MWETAFLGRGRASVGSSGQSTSSFWESRKDYRGEKDTVKKGEGRL